MNSRRLPLSRWFIPVVVLPGTVLVFVPLLLTWATRETRFALNPAGATSVEFWLAIGIGVSGAVLSIWASSMFFIFGEGTRRLSYLYAARRSLDSASASVAVRRA